MRLERERTGFWWSNRHRIHGDVQKGTPHQNEAFDGSWTRCARRRRRRLVRLYQHARLLALTVSTLRGQTRSGWLVGIDALVL